MSLANTKLGVLEDLATNSSLNCEVRSPNYFALYVSDWRLKI